MDISVLRTFSQHFTGFGSRGRYFWSQFQLRCIASAWKQVEFHYTTIPEELWGIMMHVQNLFPTKFPSSQRACHLANPRSSSVCYSKPLLAWALAGGTSTRPFPALPRGPILAGNRLLFNSEYMVTFIGCMKSDQLITSDREIHQEWRDLDRG